MISLLSNVIQYLKIINGICSFSNLYTTSIFTLFRFCLLTYGDCRRLLFWTSSATVLSTKKKEWKQLGKRYPRVNTMCTCFRSYGQRQTIKWSRHIFLMDITRQIFKILMNRHQNVGYNIVYLCVSFLRVCNNILATMIRLKIYYMFK